MKPYQFPKEDVAHYYDILDAEYILMGVEYKWEIYLDLNLNVFKAVQNNSSSNSTTVYFQGSSNRKLYRPDGGPVFITENRNVGLSFYWGYAKEEVNFKNFNSTHIRLHRLDGPAQIKLDFRNKKEKFWYLHGKIIDLNQFPVVVDGKLWHHSPITKSLILETILFDREYGAYINDIYKLQI